MVTWYTHVYGLGKVQGVLSAGKVYGCRVWDIGTRYNCICRVVGVWKYL